MAQEDGTKGARKQPKDFTVRSGTVMLNSRVTVADRKRLRDAADSMGITQTELLLSALDLFFEENGINHTMARWASTPGRKLAAP